MARSRVVAAVGVSANTLNPAAKARSGKVAEAMRQAVADALSCGLRTDEDAAEIRARMMAARERVLNGE